MIFIVYPKFRNSSSTHNPYSYINITHTHTHMPSPSRLSTPFFNRFKFGEMGILPSTSTLLCIYAEFDEEEKNSTTTIWMHAVMCISNQTIYLYSAITKKRPSVAKSFVYCIFVCLEIVWHNVICFFFVYWACLLSLGTSHFETKKCPVLYFICVLHWRRVRVRIRHWFVFAIYSRHFHLFTPTPFARSLIRLEQMENFIIQQLSGNLDIWNQLEQIEQINCIGFFSWPQFCSSVIRMMHVCESIAGKRK